MSDAVKILIVVAAFALLGVAIWAPGCEKPAKQTPAPAVVINVGAARRMGEKVYTDHVRQKVADELQKRGFAKVGGDGTPLSADQASELLSHVQDKTILHGGTKYGALGDGKILEKLQELAQWLIDHEAQIEEVVMFVLKLLALF